MRIGIGEGGRNAIERAIRKRKHCSNTGRSSNTRHWDREAPKIHLWKGVQWRALPDAQPTTPRFALALTFRTNWFVIFMHDPRWLWNILNNHLNGSRTREVGRGRRRADNGSRRSDTTRVGRLGNGNGLCGQSFSVVFSVGYE